MATDYNWLSERLGPPSSRPFLLSLLGIWCKKLFHPKEQITFDTLAAGAFADGAAAWGVLIKANNLAYQKGSNGYGLWSVVLVAPKLLPNEACELLPPIADWIRKNRGRHQEDWDREVVEFMTWVDNDVIGEPTAISVPRAIAGSVECILINCLFRRKDVPGGTLNLRLLPVVIRPQLDFAAVVKSKFWADSYRREWCDHPCDEDGAKDIPATDDNTTQADFFAIEIHGLQPNRLDELERIIHKTCDQKGYSCFFLNTGFLSAADGKPKEFSGEIQFLGALSERDAVIKNLNEVFDRYLSDAETAQLRREAIPMDEFFERFGWLMEELNEKS